MYVCMCLFVCLSIRGRFRAFEPLIRHRTGFKRTRAVCTSVRQAHLVLYDFFLPNDSA